MGTYLHVPGISIHLYRSSYIDPMNFSACMSAYLGVGACLGHYSIMICNTDYISIAPNYKMVTCCIIFGRISAEREVRVDRGIRGRGGRGITLT